MIHAPCSEETAVIVVEQRELTYCDADFLNVTGHTHKHTQAQNVEHRNQSEAVC